MRLAPLPDGLARWPAAAFPVALRAATARLSCHLQNRIDADGAVREPCRSRVLESALLLALLDRTRLEPTARSRLAAYLSGQCDSREPLDRFLARAALGGPQPGPAGHLDLGPFLSQAPNFTGPRKHALLNAVLLLLGAPASADLPAPQTFCLHGLHSWARVQVIAVKAVLAHTGGRPHLVDERDLELLLSTQHPGVLWEGNLLIHLFVLHALAFTPRHQDMVQDGIRTVLAHQRADGGMPFICDEDTWVTATAGIALHAAGAPRAALDAITRRLLRLQHPGGAWSYSEPARLTDVDCTSVAVEVLHLASPGNHHAPMSRAIHALSAVRGEDGGFPTYLAGAPSEACMTAAAINALSTQGQAQNSIIEQGLDFLADRQHADGSFPPDWSSSRHHTVFRAVLAAGRLPGAPASAPRIVRRAQDLVLGTQNADGGWGQQDGVPSDALSTAYALTALTALFGPDTSGPAARGAAFLLTWQRPDGSIASVPDSIGPRPFRFAVPALADTFTLLALGHLHHRLAHTSPSPHHPPERAGTIASTLPLPVRENSSSPTRR
ncbi:prenyltransferase/squalene oxidase repeat-containing protein [Streptomyces sp. NPDC003032]